MIQNNNTSIEIYYSWGYRSAFWLDSDKKINVSIIWSYIFISLNLIPSFDFSFHKYDGLPIRHIQILFLSVGWGQLHDCKEL